MVKLDEAHFEKARHAYDNFVPAGCEWCDIDALRAAITAYLTAARAEPVAWIRAGFLEDLHREGTHSGISTVLWLDETNPGKRHSKRIPLYLHPAPVEAPEPQVVTDEIASIIGYHLATIVSGNNQPCMSGDPRDRIQPARRRHFDRACYAAAEAITAALTAAPQKEGE